MSIAIRCLLLLVAALPSLACAQSVAPEPGEYLSERGWGQLVIRRERDARLVFALEARGSNFHSCSLEGEIRNGQATLEGEEKKPCVVSFAPKGPNVDVKSNGACRLYCGARAAFEETYYRPAPNCGRAQMRRTRDEFKRLYDRKAYAEARAKLEPLLGGCAKTTDWLDDGWIRNDLAITLYRLGDLDGCRRVLQPLAEQAALPDQEVLGGYPPSDGEAFLPIVRAARANLKICGAPPGKR